MANNKKRIKKEELRKKEKQFQFYIITFIILFILITIAAMFISNENYRGSLFGIFLFVYSVIGFIFKIPLFNRQYMYGSSGFDNSFGFRHYFCYAIMFLFGVIFTFIPFLNIINN